ncbi:MAG: type II toxin-antitoxin system HipA family toxin [Rhodanobacter sp.]
MSRSAAVVQARVLTPQGVSGDLHHEAGQYEFRYSGTTPDVAISLTMPVRRDLYRANQLLPIFQQSLPEGFVLEQLRLRLAKLTQLDPMLLLALTGQDGAIGRLCVQSPEVERLLGATSSAAKGERLSEILAWDGTENLFAELVDRYLLRTGVSGVQPKVLVPERADAAAKATLVAGDLIVKSGPAQYPGLAINEFVCMSIARAANIPVPEFFLSDKHDLFVLRRFDRNADGLPLGFEDMATLMGLGAQQKYEGSYERLAKVIRNNCPGEYVRPALAQLFDMVALSVIVGNGDAHLKNFGLLYTHPASADCRMAPAYDIVNTTAYLPDDALALTLGGSKSFQAARLNLPELAGRCDIERPSERVGQLVIACAQQLQTHADLLDEVPDVKRALHQSMQRMEAGFSRPLDGR